MASGLRAGKPEAYGTLIREKPWQPLPMSHRRLTVGYPALERLGPWYEANLLVARL
jgi:hypothetical protein